MEIQAIDIGVNLTDKRFEKDWETIIEDSLSNGIGMIITGCSKKSNLEAVKQIRQMPGRGLKCTAGLHPHNAESYYPNYSGKFEQDMEKFINQNKDIIVAVGEAGLDYLRMYSAKEKQICAFEGMIKVAEDMRMPMFLHERNAADDFCNILKNHRDTAEKSVVHCFTGTKETAKKYLNFGCMIGITGWVCDNRRNSDLVEALKYIPLDRIMIETDSPYLTPRYIRNKKRNIPSNIPYVWEEIAKIKGEDAETVREIALGNTKKFFNI